MINNISRNKQEGGGIMRYKLVGMLFAAMLMMVGSVFAATFDQTILNPLASTRITGTIDLRVEVNGTMYKCQQAACGAGANVSGVNFTYTRTAPTAGTATIACNNLTNINNGSVANYTCSFNTNVLEDVGTYTITAQVRKNTTAVLVNSTTVTLVVVDNFVPSTAFGTLTPADGVEQRTSTVTIDTEADINATTCTLFVGSKDYDVTPSSDSCSRQLSSLSDGSVSIYWVTSDGLNTSTGAERTLRINARGTSGAAAATVTTAADAVQARNNLMFVVVAVVIVTAIAGAGAFGVLKAMKGR